eukprot:318110-Pleurochrysis_carterae.AAC.1
MPQVCSCVAGCGEAACCGCCRNGEGAPGFPRGRRREGEPATELLNELASCRRSCNIFTRAAKSGKSTLKCSKCSCGCRALGVPSK